MTKRRSRIVPRVVFQVACVAVVPAAASGGCYSAGIDDETEQGGSSGRGGAAGTDVVVLAMGAFGNNGGSTTLLASPYIEMARLKGVRPGRVITRHALPNALAPIINVVALNLAYLITGVVVVEVVFVYPGLGQLMVDSVSKRDIPVVQASALIFACAYVLLNLAADVLSTLSNPRLAHRR
jgi:ABC-type microcin C transport system permease subunit YejB